MKNLFVTRLVTKKGLRIDGRWYFAERLLKIIGQQVQALRDLDDANQFSVFVRDKKRWRYVCTAVATRQKFAEVF